MSSIEEEVYGLFPGEALFDMHEGQAGLNNRFQGKAVIAQHIRFRYEDGNAWLTPHFRNLTGERHWQYINKLAIVLETPSFEDGHYVVKCVYSYDGTMLGFLQIHIPPE